MPDHQLRRDQWLLDHAANVTSISGEDGIIEKIFEVLSVKDPWCVEFGAWDGKTYSNTYNLMANRGWSGVFIEADQRKFQELSRHYSGNSRAHCLHEFVSFEGNSSMDALLARTAIPRNFDLLSIDIDGNDYHVWESMKAFRPRVVIIEYNPTIPTEIEFVQARDMTVNQGSSLLSLVELGKQKGYELVCVTEHNGIFVLNELFSQFEIQENAPAALRSKLHLNCQMFVLYDGTLVFKGLDRLPWQDLPIRQDKLQLVPRWFRTYPPRPGALWKRMLWRAWRWLYCRGSQ